MADQQIKLKDGRIVSVCEFGDRAGKPLLYCHGFPGSRLEAQLFETSACQSHVKLIAVDRPGYGQSDYKSFQKLSEWVNDVSEIADILDLGRFSVLGVSGGGPYALACAHQIPSRLNNVGVVCGLGPVYEPWAIRDMQWPARLGFTLAQRAPRLLRLVYGDLTSKVMRWNPDFLMSLLMVSAPIADNIALKRPEVRQVFVMSAKESLRKGAQGALQDFVMYSHEWGFNIKDISMVINLWHGKSDATVPFSHGNFMANRLHHARSHFFSEEGHFSLPVNHAKDIVRTLIPQV
jgi:pimeloyl-ACP methyl ester carboxylesterase